VISKAQTDVQEIDDLLVITILRDFIQNSCRVTGSGSMSARRGTSLRSIWISTEKLKKERAVKKDVPRKHVT